MSQTEKFEGQSYEVIAWANNQEVLIFEMFGSYQGEWVMISKDESNYYIYKDWYGSCSGCDAYESEMDYEDVTREKAEKFAESYKPFAIIPKQTAINMVEFGTLRQVMPANVKDGYSDDVDFDKVSEDFSAIVKIDNNIPFKPEEMLKIANQELKQKAIKSFGYDELLKSVKHEKLDSDGENHLLKIDEDLLFASVEDATGDKRYLLRVPPNMQRIKQAIAWTYNMEEGEYNPVKET
jgi:hypothetical protein